MEHCKDPIRRELQVDSRFDDLLQHFSRQVKKVSENGFPKEEEFSEELILNTIFPKFMKEPLERYLCISPAIRVDAFFQSLHPFDIVVGRVTSIIGAHVSAVLLYVVDGQRRYINDLNIVSSVESNVFTDTKSSSTDDDLKLGDKVKGVVTHVDRGERIVHISLQEKHLSDDQIRYIPLGRLNTVDDEEENNCIVDDDSRFIDPLAYIRDLERSTDFVDPHSIKRLLNQLKLPEECISLLDSARSPPTPVESAEAMREKQSCKWSMDMVGAGVKHFREKRLKEAMKCFDQSISFYPKNVEAFVARGALKANRNELKEAVEDFREALLLNPKHRNARKYIIETLSSIAKRYEKEMRWKEASRCYQDILDVDEEDKDALKQYNQIKHILLPKCVDTKHAQPTTPRKEKTLSVKSKERINKLKKLLEAETKREDESSSSTSSSTSSDSNSSSEESWIEKPNDKGSTNKKKRTVAPSSERNKVT